MTKTYRIGRAEGSDIFIDNAKISRRHAILRVSDSGKMEIVDMSSNGTSVNDVRIASNKPVPITRKDVVKFAGESILDWSQIPDPRKKWAKIILPVLAALVALIVALVAIKSCNDTTVINKPSEPGPGVPVDSPEVKNDSPKKDNDTISDKPADLSRFIPNKPKVQPSNKGSKDNKESQGNKGPKNNKRSQGDKGPKDNNGSKGNQGPHDSKSKDTQGVGGGKNVDKANDSQSKQSPEQSKRKQKVV